MLDILNLSIIALLIFISLLLYIFLNNKDVFTKLLVLNSLTSVSTLFICFLSIFKANSSYIDIAIIYFMLSFIAGNAYLKYFKKQSK